MPISLRSLSGSSSQGNYLSANNVVAPSGNTSDKPALWGNASTISNIDISSGLTEMCDVSPLDQEVLLIKQLIVGGLNIASGTVSFELEVDGVTVLTSAVSANTANSLIYVGDRKAGTPEDTPMMLSDIEVRSNFKVRANKALSTTASVTFNVAKIRRY